MRILVAGSNDEAYYLIGSLVGAGHDVAVACESRGRARILSEAYDVEVVQGDPTCVDTFDDVMLRDPDIFVSLLDRDSDNLVACRVATMEYGIPKTVCTVRDPRNVELFRRLGVTHVLSGAIQLARAVSQATEEDFL